jgi:hypothetical protein
VTGGRFCRHKQRSGFNADEKNSRLPAGSLGEARNLDQDSSILMSVLFFVAPE